MDMTVEVPELPELTFDEASHIYRLNGDIIPSVSKLMEPLKDQCYGGISKRTLENAAIKGSAVHNSIENWIKFGIDDIPSEHRGYFNGFMEWWKQYKPRVFGSEVRIYHIIECRPDQIHAHLVIDWLGDAHCSNCREDVNCTEPFCQHCGARLDEPEVKEY